MKDLSFLTNPMVISALVGWLGAQALKVPIDYLRTKRWNWALLASAGGMPSSHAALMTATTLSIGLYSGFSSPAFVLGLAITGIVVYDATGVRRQAGLQAERINRIVNMILTEHKWPTEDWNDLREVIGHSPAEAAGGVFFGALVAVAVYLLMPPVL